MLLLPICVLATLAHSTPLSKTTTNPPTATLSKTVFIGRTLPEFNQDLFLGIKYADKPTRFTPSSLKTTYASNDSNSGAYDLSVGGFTSYNHVYYNASEYGYDCPAYGSDTTTLVNQGLARLDEDWGVGRDCRLCCGFMGVGGSRGATADPRYNMSYIIQQGALNGKPVLGVSINYRMAAFGFLDSEEVRAEGNTNLALRDQRTAMHWVKKHIEAFGGDPDRITIWGESANHGIRQRRRAPIQRHLMASTNVRPTHRARRSSCTNATNTLQCLRDLPYSTIYNVAYEGLEWFATIDNIFISQYPQISYKEGKLAKVPILLGTNTDEGTSFGTTGTNTGEECIEQLTLSKRWVLDRTEATEILSQYPNIPALGCPYGWGNTTWPSLGLQYKRYESIAGDLAMFAPRRMLADTMAKFENVYSYRWDVAALNTSTTIGVQHFAEIPFVFANPVQNITALGSDPTRLELGQLAARMWTSFVTNLDPNGHGVSHVPQWPEYSSKITNFVFRLPRKDSYIEDDTYRATGIDVINSIAR
ncbi:uncharacterized protein N7443_005745 [Penicillium atrosanguineum]|uniref:uncharacterized protein n=1 Tax=Penicillium atrosanguineum TaxID=1132637 RepID=UPI00239FF704|nr:uncharacterized protein N7443_005745 [Penicillium atrosanguineum]KAJ5300743.1 hypothetical protein N7443_005745 [Penicillium atrosanguineum]